MDGGMRGGFFAVNVKPEHRQSFLHAIIFEAQSEVVPPFRTVSQLFLRCIVFRFHAAFGSSKPDQYASSGVRRSSAEWGRSAL